MGWVVTMLNVKLKSQNTARMIVIYQCRQTEIKNAKSPDADSKNCLNKRAKRATKRSTAFKKKILKIDIETQMRLPWGVIVNAKRPAPSK